MELTKVATIVIATIAASLTGWSLGAQGQQIVRQSQDRLPSGPVQNMEGREFTIIPQGEDICRAGSKQWTGTVNVSNDNALFYCKLILTRAGVHLGSFSPSGRVLRKPRESKG